MISRDPSYRDSANGYLQQQKGKAFPEYFYTFLQSYMQIFSAENSMAPDQKIARCVKNNLPLICPNCDHISVFRIQENLPSLLSMSSGDSASFDGAGLSLIVALVTANIRSLRFVSSKMGALRILSRLAEHVSDETILDRILPYVVRAVDLMVSLKRTHKIYSDTNS